MKLIRVLPIASLFFHTIHATQSLHPRSHLKYRDNSGEHHILNNNARHLSDDLLGEINTRQPIRMSRAAKRDAALVQPKNSTKLERWSFYPWVPKATRGQFEALALEDEDADTIYEEAPLDWPPPPDAAPLYSDDTDSTGNFPPPAPENPAEIPPPLVNGQPLQPPCVVKQVPGMDAPNNANAKSQFVARDAQGLLQYAAYNPAGDRIADFSGVGFYGGADPPEVPVLVRLKPTGGDDTDMIQQAILNVSYAPVQNGFRGAIQLEAGTFRMKRSVRIANSGVVLQGVPGGGTRIIAEVNPLKSQELFLIEGPASGNKETAQRKIVDQYVPVGANILTLENVADLKNGDTIVVGRIANQEWIKTLGMDKFPSVWRPGEVARSLRVVQSIDPVKKTILLDNPMTISIDQAWGGGWVAKYTSTRIKHVGIQNLVVECPFNRGRTGDQIRDPNKHNGDIHFADEMFINFVITMKGVEQSWVRNVIGEYFHNFIQILEQQKSGQQACRAITIDRCEHHYKSDFLNGQNSFKVGGQLILMKNCASEANFHNYLVSSLVMGPNVFTNCSVYNTPPKTRGSNMGPHSHFSTGMLYDVIKTDGDIEMMDADAFGSGHGWQAGNSVVWNAEAGRILVQSPPTSANFEIGSFAKSGNGKIRSKVHTEVSVVELRGTHVAPWSLYLAQLADRQLRSGQCK
ncbi:uncharacterized protein VTP21DRAFT_4727 [Calcarisporiella thermophila]|uniref:uncharacterized protein n=1 Tax=Calcarisporiella thermophila TaxID=911321 RepID=UPI0037443CB4